MNKQQELPKAHREWLGKNGFELQEEYYVKRISSSTDQATEESRAHAYNGYIFVAVAEDGKYASGPCFRVAAAGATAIAMIELQCMRTCPTPAKAVQEGIKAFNKILQATAGKRLTADGFVPGRGKGIG